MPDNTQSQDIKSSESEFHETVEKHMNTQYTDKEHQEIGTPIKDEEALTQKHEDYCKKIVDLLDTNKIDPDNAETLLNKDIYNALDEKKRGRVDMAAINILQLLSRIKYIWDKDHEESQQMRNIVDTVWLAKERIESEFGDVYKV